MQKARLFREAILLALLVAGAGSCCKKKSSAAPPVNPVTLTRIEINPGAPVVFLGIEQKFLAVGIYSDDTRKNLTDTAEWSSSDNEVAKVPGPSGKGCALASKEGTAKISASQEGVTGTALMTVVQANLVSIDITPKDPSIPVGKSIAFTATGNYEGDLTKDLTAQAAWTSSDDTVASFPAENPKGSAKGLKPGTVTVTATVEGVAGTTGLTVTDPRVVSISVTPINPTIPRGLDIQFTATGIYDNETTSDLTTQVDWTSSDGTIAAFGDPSKKGLAKALAVGQTTITATQGSIAGSTLLTVVETKLVSIAVTPADATVPRGVDVQYTATGTFDNTTTQDLTAQVTWASSDPSVAAFSGDPGKTGKASALVPGTTTISATLGTVTGSTGLTVTETKLVSIAVTPVNPSAPRLTTVQFTATGTYDNQTTQDLTSQATWSSSAPSIATVGDTAADKGLARALAEGTTTISAAVGTISGNTVLTVTQAVPTAIDVTPKDPTVPLGTPQAFIAKATYSDSSTLDVTTLATWASSDETVAKVSNAGGSRGVAATLKAGTTTISATLAGVTGSTGLTVTGVALTKIAISPQNITLPLGLPQQFKATGTYSDSSTQDVTELATWSSSSETVATISNVAGSRGLASTHALGTTTIGAAIGTISDSTTLTVVKEVLVRIDVTPVAPSVPPGKTVAFAATGTYTDQSSRDITALAFWASSDEAVATVSNAAGSKGLASALTLGTADISAALEGITGSTTLTVKTAPFVRCDPNIDGRVDIADAVWIIEELFKGGHPTVCKKSADCNGDGSVNLADALYCIDYELRHGPRPPLPFPTCGYSQTQDDLTCDPIPTCP